MEQHKKSGFVAKFSKYVTRQSISLFVACGIMIVVFPMSAIYHQRILWAIGVIAGVYLTLQFVVFGIIWSIWVKRNILKELKAMFSLYCSENPQYFYSKEEIESWINGYGDQLNAYKCNQLNYQGKLKISSVWEELMLYFQDKVFVQYSEIGDIMKEVQCTVQGTSVSLFEVYTLSQVLSGEIESNPKTAVYFKYLPAKDLVSVLSDPIFIDPTVIRYLEERPEVIGTFGVFMEEIITAKKTIITTDDLVKYMIAKQYDLKYLCYLVACEAKTRQKSSDVPSEMRKIVFNALIVGIKYQGTPIEVFQYWPLFIPSEVVDLNILFGDKMTPIYEQRKLWGLLPDERLKDMFYAIATSSEGTKEELMEVASEFFSRKGYIYRAE